MNQLAVKNVPIAWTIAGSDSSGGAGIQADLKVFAHLGVHGAAIVSALTAQSHSHASAMLPTPADFVTKQLTALQPSLNPQAVKIGMLGSAANVKAVAACLVNQKTFVVLDPVLATSSGLALADAACQQTLVETLLPYVDLLTPNRHEAELLLQRSISNDDEIEAAARDLCQLGAKAVLLKGGHADDASAFSQDYFYSAHASFWLSAARSPNSIRGTGCILASAIAAGIALGEELHDAVIFGRAYVNRAIRQSQPLADGYVAHHGSWPVAASDMPWVTSTAAAGRKRPMFPNCGTAKLGFYAIVDRAAWLKRLLPLGVTTAQLRIKDLSGDALAAEISAATELAHEWNIRLFINDYWELAIKYNAYGVHLGQEDLDTANIEAIAAAGLRLGISTHSYFEAARAKALRPSYIALGPIFPTTCKSMRFGPQGIPRLSEWRQLFEAPLVAIGGITLREAPAIRAAGADGIAVISDITKASDPEARTSAWLEFFTAADVKPKSRDEIPLREAHL